MAQTINKAKTRLKSGELAIGCGIRLVRNVDIIKIMKAAGFDWMFIDCEHGSMSIETACELSVAAQDSGVLDGGAMGIVIPHVDTPEEAKEIADKLRYPPRGHRSVGGADAQFDYAPPPLGEMTKAIDDQMLLTVMIETPKAVENAEAIAAVPGIDCLLVGSSDLSMELGIPGDRGHQKIQDSVDKVVAACKKHNKWPGIGGAYSDELLKLYTGKGMKMILSGNDMPLMIAATKALQGKVRAYQK
jgi:4-hydroxy-2-oxoheptanedioate aldolase